MSFLLNAIGEAADKLADAASSALEIPEAGDDEILQVLQVLRHPVRWPSGISELHARVETYPQTVAVLVGSNEPRHVAILGTIVYSVCFIYSGGMIILAIALSIMRS